MEIMPCRMKVLEDAIIGYQKSNTPLICGQEQNGSISFYAAGANDDLGIYYFVPKIAHLFGTGVKESLDVFFISIIGISCFLGICGLLFCFRRWESRLLSISILLGIVTYLLLFCDVSLVAPAIVLGLVPWACYFTRTKAWPHLFLAYSLMAGCFIGYANIIRTHSGTAILILLCFLLIANRQRRLRGRILFLTILVA
jgi:hypothetical protein